MAKIKLSKKPHSMVTFLIKVRRSFLDLSSQAAPREIIKLDVIHISIENARFALVEKLYNNTRMKHSHEV